MGGVAAIAPDDAWAVGLTLNETTIAEHWDGTAWTIVPTPNPGGINDALVTVSAISSSDVWAAGDDELADSTIQPLFDHWDGTAWTQVPEAPGTEQGGGVINSISAQSSTNVWAAGYEGTQVAGQYLPLVEHWDGTTWALVTIPEPANATAPILKSIVAIGPSDAWTVGNDPVGPTASFVEHWDGTAWTIVQQLQGSYFQWAVAGLSTTDVWTVGDTTHVGQTTPSAFIQHWDGAKWKSLPVPKHGYGTVLQSTAEVSPTSIWAVGWYEYNAQLRTAPITLDSAGPC